MLDIPEYKRGIQSKDLLITDHKKIRFKTILWYTYMFTTYLPLYFLHKHFYIKNKISAEHSVLQDTELPQCFQRASVFSFYITMIHTHTYKLAEALF